MMAFLVLGDLPWRVLLLFILQMLVITAVLRGVIACQMRVLRGTWRVRADFVVVAHLIALMIFAAMTDFVNLGASTPTTAGVLLHSMAVLWPLQLALLGADLAIRAGMRFLRGKAASQKPTLR